MSYIELEIKKEQYRNLKDNIKSYRDASKYNEKLNIIDFENNKLEI